jgi:hypothetical protein
VDHFPRLPQGPTEEDGLCQWRSERRGEAEDAPPPADKVEARELARQQRRVTAVAVQLDPRPEQQLRDYRSEARGQDERIAESSGTDKEGSCTLRPGPGRLRPQPGRISGLEEPSFHGEAG